MPQTHTYNQTLFVAQTFVLALSRSLARFSTESKTYSTIIYSPLSSLLLLQFYSNVLLLF